MTTPTPLISSTVKPRKRRRIFAATGAGLAVVIAAVGYSRRSSLFGSSDPEISVKWSTVAPAEMEVKVNKEGELQSVENIEIMSYVEGLNTIVQIVKEGAYVNQGDVLVQLDSSPIRQKIEDTTLELQRSESDVAAARNVLEIQKTQNDANLEAAKVDVALSKLSIQEYEQGTYPADLETAQVTLRMAKIMTANKEDDLKQTKELYTKGFVNLADVKQAELAVETTKNDVAKADAALTVLTKYTHPMMGAGKESYMKQANQKLARTMIENQNNLIRAQTALATTESQHTILQRRIDRFKEQLDFCTIKAPSSGLVVYNNLGGRGDSSTTIQEGTQVRERQVLLRLPDTSAMKAVVRINEGQVIRLRTNQRALVRITGMRDAIGASLTRISPVSDSSSRWLNPDTREYPVELKLDWTPRDLKPGIGVQVEILVDDIAKAIAVPLSAIYSAGADNFIFVRSPGSDSPVPRKVAVGVANDTQVCIPQGLAAGEQVALLEAGEGRELLEKAGIQPAANNQQKIRPSDGKERSASAAKPADAGRSKPETVAVAPAPTVVAPAATSAHPSTLPTIGKTAQVDLTP